MVTYNQYLENAKKINSNILSEKDWTELHNELRINKVYFKRIDKLENIRQENILLEIGAFNGKPV